jgi:hypothetical protein
MRYNSNHETGRTIDSFVNTWKVPDRFRTQGYFDMTGLRALRPDVEVIWNETK